MNIIQQLQGGSVLRYREGIGFYAVRRGVTNSVSQSEAEAAVRAGKVRPESGKPDKFGVYHFTLHKGAAQ